MRVHVHKRNEKFLTTIVVPDEATVEDLKNAFCEKLHYYPERQRFTIKHPKGPALTDGTLRSNGIEDGSNIYFKDLGVQISWRLVFVLEYLGPLFIFPLFYNLSHLIHGQEIKPCLTQRLGFSLVMFHFIKRELETLFVHRFSNATMPIHRLPVNCAHYWILSGVLIAYYLFHPKYQPPINNVAINLTLSGLMVLFELLNLQTHLVLRNLRARGSKVRGIPNGWGFNYVSCANYMWEILAWMSFCIMINCLTGWIFLIAASLQMFEWALKKHRNYRKEFKNYPPARTALIPFVI